MEAASIPAPAVTADLPQLGSETWVKIAIYAAFCAATLYLLYRFFDAQAQRTQEFQDNMLAEYRSNLAAQQTPSTSKSRRVTRTNVPLSTMNGHGAHTTAEVEEVIITEPEPESEPESEPEVYEEPELSADPQEEGQVGEPAPERPVTEGRLDGPVG